LYRWNPSVLYTFSIPLTKSKLQNDRYFLIKTVINILIKRIDLKSEIFPIVFSGCVTGFKLNPSWISYFTIGNVTWV
jgi:hypothetical protein